MMDEYCKCRFCKSYDEYDGCEWGCNNFEDYKTDKNRLIEKAKEKGISVSELIDLVNLG